MRQFSLTANSFTGSVTFKYDKDGYLIYYSSEAELDAKQITWLLKNLPLTVDEMRDKIKSVPNFKLVEIDFEISFEVFWNKYNHKTVSSRLKSKSLWDKLSKTDQVKAYNHIDKYNRSRGDLGKKYCETYLRAMLWNN